MSRRTITILTIALALWAVNVVADDQDRRKVAVDHWSLSGGTLQASFDIYEEDRSGSFEWAVTFVFGGLERTDRRTSTWSAGDATVDASMYLGGDVGTADVRRVRVVRVEVD